MISIYALLSQTIHGNEQKPEKQAVRFNEATATSPDYNPYPGTVRFNEETATLPDYNPYPGTVSKISTTLAMDFSCQNIFPLWLVVYFSCSYLGSLPSFTGYRLSKSYNHCC